MLAIKPINITAAMVTASNAGADDAAYNPATTYNTLGTRVYVADTGYSYQLVQAPATGKYPPTEPLFWIKAAPSNRQAMFDTEISTATVTTGDLTATLSPGVRFNAIGFAGLVGTSLQVVQKTASGAVLTSKIISLKSNPGGWYSYFFEPRLQVREAYVLGLIPVSGSTLEIRITGPAACAAVVLGNSFDIGQAQYGASNGIADYSKKTTSADGVQLYQKGRFSRLVSVSLFQDAGTYAAVNRFFEDVRATPIFFITVPDDQTYEPLTLFGAYSDFRITVPYPKYNLCTLEIEGLSS